MSGLRTIAALVLACALLPACTAPAPKPRMTVIPHSEIRHSAGANLDHYELGKYYQASGKLELAMDSYTQAIKLNTRPLEAGNALATLYSKQGRLPEAESILRKALTQHPAAAYLHNNLGYIYLLQGDHAAAIRELRAAISLDPRHEWARNNLALAEAALARLAAADVTAPLSAEATKVVPFVVWGETSRLGANVKSVAGNTAGAPAPMLVVDAAGQFRLEISNGNGVPGLAKRVSRILVQHGIAVHNLTNQPPFRQLTTEIQYKAGFEREAEQLRNTLRGYAIVARASKLSNRVDLRVVLGKNVTLRIAELDAGSPQLAALTKSQTGFFYGPLGIPAPIAGRLVASLP